jgi:hypothetical protein
MHIEQLHWHGQGWEPASFGHLPEAQLVLLFGSPTTVLQNLPCSTEAEHVFGSCFTEGSFT